MNNEIIEKQETKDYYYFRETIPEINETYEDIVWRTFMDYFINTCRIDIPNQHVQVFNISYNINRINAGLGGIHYSD
jgi:hypothetical protein